MSARRSGAGIAMATSRGSSPRGSGRWRLRVPQVRDGSFSSELFERYQRSEQALVCTLMEMVVNGVSTRKVAQITEELCGKSLLQVDGLRPVPGARSAGQRLE